MINLYEQITAKRNDYTESAYVKLGCYKSLYINDQWSACAGTWAWNIIDLNNFKKVYKGNTENKYTVGFLFTIKTLDMWLGEK